MVNGMKLSAIFKGEVQARSQDRFWRVQDPQKVDLLDPQS